MEDRKSKQILLVSLLGSIDHRQFQKILNLRNGYAKRTSDHFFHIICLFLAQDHHKRFVVLKPFNFGFRALKLILINADDKEQTCQKLPLKT